MGLFNFFRNKKTELASDNLTVNINQMPPTSEKNYNNIIKIVEIISKGDPNVKENFALLANGLDKFLDKHTEYYEEFIDKDSDKHTALLLVTAYWLCDGNYEDHQFGVYIDWKEETDDIIQGLNKIINKLSYPITINDIVFTGEEPTDVALEIINKHLQQSGYTLFYLDINSDCYNLFIVSYENYTKIIQLGKEIDFYFYNTYE